MKMKSQHYWRHFGLQADPFPEQGSASIYISQQWQEYLQFLSLPQNYAKALLLVTGEPGVGKTTLCQQFSQHLPSSARLHHVNAKKDFGAEDLLQTINQGFSLAVNIADHNLYDAADQQLQHLQQQSLTHILIIDDAEQLPLDAKQLCLYLVKQQLTTQACINIILIGQPQLAEQFAELTEQKIESIHHYTVNRLHVSAFNQAQTAEFLKISLKNAGDEANITLLGRDDIQQIYQRSQGFPAKINQQARQALLTLYGELYQNDTSIMSQAPTLVTDATVNQAKQKIQAFKQGLQKLSFRRFYWWGGALAAIFILLYWIYPMIQHSTAVNTQRIAIPTGSSAGQQTETASVRNQTNIATLVQAKDDTKKAAVFAQSQPKMVRLVENGKVTWVPESQIENELHPDASQTQPDRATATTKPVETTPVKKTTTPPAPQEVTTETSTMSLTTDEQQLLNIDKNLYTLQLFVASSAENAQRFVRQHRISDLASIYRVKRQNRTLYFVILGQFANQQSANDSLKQLDKAIIALKPWPRSYASVHTDIHQFAASAVT